MLQASGAGTLAGILEGRVLKKGGQSFVQTFGTQVGS